MSWERKGNGRVFRAHVRHKGTRRRIYFGSGRLAEMAYLTLKMRHEKRLQDWYRLREENARWNDLQTIVRDYDKALSQLLTVVLNSQGIHRYRNTWRRIAKKRGETMNKTTLPLPNATSLSELLQQAQQGDVEARAQVQQRLGADHPVWRQVGDLAAHLEQRLIHMVSGENLLLADGVKATLQQKKEELGYDRANGLEKLLMERVILSWLETVYLDRLALQQSEPATESVAMERRRQTAYRRHRLAVKTLVQVRGFLNAGISC